MVKVTALELENFLNQQLCNGSTVKITEMNDNKVIVRLAGACEGCPGVRITLQNIIEAVIKEKLPAVREVLLDESCDEEMISFARRLLNHNIQANS